MLELFWRAKANAKKNEKGFTLVELIVVVAILGILAVIGITRFAGLTDNARVKADVATASSLASAAQVHIANKATPYSGTTNAIDPADLVTEGLIESPKAAQSVATANSPWVINYNADTKSLTVTSNGTTFYPAP